MTFCKGIIPFPSHFLKITWMFPFLTEHCWIIKSRKTQFVMSGARLFWWLQLEASDWRGAQGDRCRHVKQQEITFHRYSTSIAYFPSKVSEKGWWTPSLQEHRDMLNPGWENHDNRRKYLRVCLILHRYVQNNYIKGNNISDDRLRQAQLHFECQCFFLWKKTYYLKYIYCYDRPNQSGAPSRLK